MMNLIAWIFRIAIFVVLAIFASKNSQPITIQYYLDQSVDLPLSVALFLFFAVGAVISAIVVRCRC